MKRLGFLVLLLLAVACSDEPHVISFSGASAAASCPGGCGDGLCLRIAPDPTQCATEQWSCWNLDLSCDDSAAAPPLRDCSTDECVVACDQVVENGSYIADGSCSP